MADAANHIVHLLPFKMALIGGLGIGAQWLAWKLQKPAIVLMAIAGLLFGPLIGYLMTLDLQSGFIHFLENFRLDPVNDFGDLLRPIIGISVAIILFEGGLTLRFKELQDSGRAVRRMVLAVTPIAWLLGTLSARYIVQLPWDISAMVGGLFVVTGPTVIIPLLRQAHLADRPANVLKWEGIVNDPVGALLAVGAYEYIRFTAMGESLYSAFAILIIFAFLGGVVGILAGYGLAWAFRKGHIPEYLKAPVTLAVVLLIYVLSNQIVEETGLLAVTTMGMTMANTKYASMVEMRRFKENIAVLLVSGVFVILTATLTPDVIGSFFTDWRIWGFVLAMMFFVRPIAVYIGTAFSGLSWKEQLIVSWVAPRGIVAVAVAGFFATELVAMGREDGEVFVTLAFALVFATVLCSSFTVTPLAKLLGLATEHKEGVLIVGANPWSLGLAKALKDMDVPVTVADTNWRRLRGARLDGHHVFYGEVLSEHADYNLDHSKFQHLMSLTPNDAYNSLVCVEFAPELGRHRVFQLSGQEKDDNDPGTITFTSRGRIMTQKGRTFDAMTRDWWGGWRFRATTLSENYRLAQFREDRGESLDIMLAKRADGSLDIYQSGQKPKDEPGSTLLTFGPVREAKAETVSTDSAGQRGSDSPLPA